MHPEEVCPSLVPVPADHRPSGRKLFQRADFAVLFVLSVALLVGCGIFDPPRNPGKPPEPPPEYRIPSQPGYVLVNLRLAYNNRDSVACQVVYDSSYVGTSQDLNDPPGTTPFSFTYTDEVHHVATLYHTPTISSVDFDIGPESSWTRLGSEDPEHPDWAVIQIAGSSLNIRVYDGADTWVVGGSTEFFVFSFQPTTPAPGSPSDTLWKIVKWTESRAAGP